MNIDRYHRQILLKQIGQVGQRKLATSQVLIIGCGALGCMTGQLLARAGVGRIRLADRDIVEMTNLQRQVLFDEHDAAQGLPKAVAAAQHLARINSSISIEPQVIDVDGDNIERLAGGVDLILDGTDNVATRYLINDVSVKLGVAWIYGGCVGTQGRVMVIFPRTGPCLRCLFPQPLDPVEVETCDTAGVLGPAACMVGAVQAAEAIKLLSGNEQASSIKLLSFDLWTGRFSSIDLTDQKRLDCPTCGKRQFEFLASIRSDSAARLCGQNAVQVWAVSGGLSLEQAAQRLQSAGNVQVSPYMVRCRLAEGGLVLTAFADGRVIVSGTADPARARAVVSRYFGV